jgi:hypothetical protein
MSPNNYQCALQNPINSGFNTKSTSKEIIKGINLTGKIEVMDSIISNSINAFAEIFLASCRPLHLLIILVLCGLLYEETIVEKNHNWQQII